MAGDPVTFNGDVAVLGTLIVRGGVKIPSGSITDDAVQAGAGVQYTKLEQQRRAVHRQPNTAAAAETAVITAIVGSTGTVLGFKAGCIGPCTGADTVSVDLKKNGATILTAPISLTSAQAAYAQVAAAIASAGLVAGDVLSVVVTPNHSSGVLGTGVFAVLNWREDAL
jgi:hypothetical protein